MTITGEERCPSCARVTREDLNKYDVTKNKWVGFEAFILMFKSMRYPLRTLVVLFGIPGAIMFTLAFARFLLVPTQIASNAPTSSKMGATAASFVRAPLVTGVVQASAFGGQPVTTQEVQSINAVPSAIQVGFGTTTPFGTPGQQPQPSAPIKTVPAATQW